MPNKVALLLTGTSWSQSLYFYFLFVFEVGLPLHQFYVTLEMEFRTSCMLNVMTIPKLKVFGHPHPKHPLSFQLFIKQEGCPSPRLIPERHIYINLALLHGLCSVITNPNPRLTSPFLSIILQNSLLSFPSKIVQHESYVCDPSTLETKGKRRQILVPSSV